MTPDTKVVFTGQNQEGHKYFKRVKVKKEKSGDPEPPPAFMPDEIKKTTAKPPRKVLTFVQAVSEALEEKEN